MEWAEIQFEVMVSDADESFDAADTPAMIAAGIAIRKNKATAEMLHDRTDNPVIISADTIVVLSNNIIGKPADRNQAITTLEQLSGQRHEVITAVCISDYLRQEVFTESTFVTFHDLTHEQIVHYVDAYQPFDKAGAYAIQEWIGVVGIKRIEGDFYNVMGLPVSRLIQHLNQHFLNIVEQE